LSRRETAITTIAQLEPSRVIVGVDTHGEVHVACALDQLGRQLATRQAATTPAGYRALLAWARSLGEVQAWGLTARLAVGGVSRIRSMLKPRLERCWPAR
jgi:transposase